MAPRELDAVINPLYNAYASAMLTEAAAARAGAQATGVWRDIHDDSLAAAQKDVARTSKRLIRALFRAGQGGIGEAMIGVEIGTFAPFAIQAAFNRL